ncbi:hypothetical protein BH09MYX1_BH09MYX1_14740 [soil metagenome]
MSEADLRGNGAFLVRERAVAGRVQKGLERLYLIDGAPNVGEFLSPAEDGEREVLLVREDDEGLAVELKIPMLGNRTIAIDEGADLDRLCQLIEGVSHFVYLAHRAQGERSTTALEMELQAEVDKYVIIATSLGALDVKRSATLRERLYEDVRFSHADDTELGERYRVANRAASRFVEGLERRFVAEGNFTDLRVALRKFFHVGQSEKMHLAR